MTSERLLWRETARIEIDNYKAVPAHVWLLYRWGLTQGVHNKMADAAVQPCPTSMLTRLLCRQGSVALYS